MAFLERTVEGKSPFLFYRQRCCLINFEMRDKWIGCKKPSPHFARLG